MTTEASKPLDLDAIRARCEKATAGPWLTESPGVHTDGPAKGWARGSVIAATAPGKDNRVYATPSGGTYPSADLNFIAHARTDVPALVSECKRLREALAEIRDTFEIDWNEAQEIARLALGDPTDTREKDK